MLKLRVAVRMAVAFLRFAVGLQTVPHFVEQFGNHWIAHFVAHSRQLFGQDSYALARPPKTRFRIAPSSRFDHPLQTPHYLSLLLLTSFSSAPSPPSST